MTLLVTCLCLLANPGPEPPEQVILYTAHDRQFSEPIVSTFEQQTGIKVLAVYDTESTKTVGLVNRIRAEKNKPRCDVFWNNEIVNTLRLKQEGLLQPCQPPEAENYPAQFRDPEGYWYGFAARARVLLVHDLSVPAGEEPTSIYDLCAPRWRGQVGIAKPLFGTTASHVACLFAALGQERAAQLLADLKKNDIRILGGNKQCAQAVSRGLLKCALTDTDDAMIEIRAQKPVRLVYLDGGADQLGTLFLPNTLMMIRGCPNPTGAEKLINYLLSAEVETRLANGPAAQIPLNKTFQGQVSVKTPQEIKPMEVDFSKAAELFQQAAKHIEEHFLE